MSAGLDGKGMSVAREPWFCGLFGHRQMGPSGVQERSRPDTTEGAVNLVCAFPNMRANLRVEPPGIPTAFWRSLGPSHNVFVIESFIDELAAAAKQDAVA